MNKLPPGGLYAILNITTQTPQHAALQAAQAIQGGAVVVQYRHKTDDRVCRHAGAQAVLKVTAAANVPLLINDDVELAATLGADGVHIGRGDGGILQARLRLGDNAIIGATCHASVQYAAQAIAAGADYVSFGRFFVSQTKPGASSASINVLTQAQANFAVPLVAIGGINADNGRALLQAGADFLAVSAALFDADDVVHTARTLAKLFI